jgi:hypothetical protein
LPRCRACPVSALPYVSPFRKQISLPNLNNSGRSLGQQQALNCMLAPSFRQRAGPSQRGLRLRARGLLKDLSEGLGIIQNGAAPVPPRIGIRQDSQLGGGIRTSASGNQIRCTRCRAERAFDAVRWSPETFANKVRTRPLSNGDADVRILPPQPASRSLRYQCQRGLKTVRHRGVSQVGALNHGI